MENSFLSLLTAYNALYFADPPNNDSLLDESGTCFHVRIWSGQILSESHIFWAYFAVLNASFSAFADEYFTENIARIIKNIIRLGRMISKSSGCLCSLLRWVKTLRAILKREIKDAIIPDIQNILVPISIGILDNGK
jgi:hypothetical protein